MRKITKIAAVLSFCLTFCGAKKERKIYIIAAAYQKEANALAVDHFGIYAKDTFSVVYIDSKTSKEYYIASWPIQSNKAEAFSNALKNLEKGNNKISTLSVKKDKSVKAMIKEESFKLKKEKDKQK